MDASHIEAIAKAMAGPLKKALQKLADRIAALEADRAAHESAKAVRDAYTGVWRQDTYLPGELTTCKGSLWLCLETTATKPGDSGQWKLVSKHGGPPQ